MNSAGILRGTQQSCFQHFWGGCKAPFVPASASFFFLSIKTTAEPTYVAILVSGQNRSDK